MTEIIKILEILYLLQYIFTNIRGCLSLLDLYFSKTDKQKKRSNFKLFEKVFFRKSTLFKKATLL